MDNITIRKGRCEDAQDFSQLILSADPIFSRYLFGSDIGNLMKNLFQHTGNHSSFEHSHFIEVNAEIAGVALAYNYKQEKRENLRTSLLFLKYSKWTFFRQLPYLLKSEHIVAQIIESECYLSNFAVYPKFRGLGFGTKLLGVVEEEARKTGSKRMVLEAEIDNKGAIKLFERLGYSIEQRLPDFKIRDKKFEFFKMSKDIQENSNIA
jgi:ribosomal protein S18 acetylase RimI-like enzyme